MATTRMESAHLKYGKDCEMKSKYEPLYYQRQHEEALRQPIGSFEGSIVSMMSAFHQYRHAHQQQYGSGIGEDGVLGSHWEDLGLAIIGLLNGETGRLDCGTIDSHVRQALREEGFTGER